MELDGNNTRDGDYDTLTFTWVGGFEDGTVSGDWPIVTFAQPGVYEITLTVDDGFGGTDTDNVTITILGE